MKGGDPQWRGEVSKVADGDGGSATGGGAPEYFDASTSPPARLIVSSSVDWTRQTGNEHL
jgi:hypothetical protein